MADVYGGSDGMRPGRAGERWTNPTDKTWFQWVSSLRKPCARCLRRHGNLFPYLQGKLHTSCQCKELPVPPGATAPIQARTPAQTFDLLDSGARAELVGAGVVRLLMAKLVTSGDVAGTEETGWLDMGLAAVVRRKRLSVDQLVGAGIDRATAERAAGPAPVLAAGAGAGR